MASNKFSGKPRPVSALRRVGRELQAEVRTGTRPPHQQCLDTMRLKRLIARPHITYIKFLFAEPPSESIRVHRWFQPPSPLQAGQGDAFDEVALGDEEEEDGGED